MTLLAFGRLLQSADSLLSKFYRDGALRWNLWQDTAIAHRFIECFIVETWAEHYRQYQRFTVSDKQLEDRALSFVQAQSAHAKFFVFARPQRILPARVPGEP